MISFEQLTKNIIVHNEQGYALYYYENGEVIEKVYGKLDINKDEKIGFDSNFRLASVSKQFVAYSIIDLINKNKLTLDTVIKTLYPELPSYFNDITVKHLLNHTSGIYDYEDMKHEEDVQIKDTDIIKFLKTTDKTYFKPGSNYQYSNTGYILLGLIIEKVSNRAIKDYIENEVFAKAKMNNSKVNLQGITNILRRAYGHVIDEKGNLEMKDQYWCSATIGDGGLYSSINDLKKWCIYLSNSDIFNIMKVPNYINENTYNEYGYGIRNINVNGKEIIYHCGSTIGTNTILLFSKDYNICLLFLTNINNIDTTIMKDNLVEYLK